MFLTILKNNLPYLKLINFNLINFTNRTNTFQTMKCLFIPPSTYYSELAAERSSIAVMFVWSLLPAYFIFLLLSKLLSKLAKVLAAFVKGTISAVWRHVGTFAGAFVAEFLGTAVAGFLALMLHNNVETMEALKEAFNKLSG